MGSWAAHSAYSTRLNQMFIYPYFLSQTFLCHTVLISSPFESFTLQINLPKFWMSECQLQDLSRSKYQLWFFFPLCKVREIVISWNCFYSTQPYNNNKVLQLPSGLQHTKEVAVMQPAWYFLQPFRYSKIPVKYKTLHQNLLLVWAFN